MKVQQAALADALKLLKRGGSRRPGGVIKLRALEAMAKAAADGKATKIIIPSELQGLAGLAAGAKAIFDTEDPEQKR